MCRPDRDGVRFYAESATCVSVMMAIFQPKGSGVIGFCRCWPLIGSFPGKRCFLTQRKLLS